MIIRNIQAGDWDAIMATQARAYTELPPESLEVLQSKWHDSPSTCFICETSQGLHLGYLLAHAWYQLAPPHLEEPLEKPLDQEITQMYKSTADHSNTAHIDAERHLFLHDMALAPEAFGLGLGSALFKRLRQSAEALAYNNIRLVAVLSLIHI